jgi:hypothetical protein
MLFFGKRRVEEKLDELDAKLAESFARVKQDTGLIYQWLNYFYSQNEELRKVVSEQQGSIASLQEELRHMPATKEQVKEIIDRHYDFSALLGRLRQLEEQLERIAAMKQKERQIQQVQRPTAEPARQLVQEMPALRERTSALKEKILSRITRNSKDYIKGMILSMINKYSRISAIQLREMLVEEQGVCSKSSFYRILEELEKGDDITVISSGREKVYVSRVSKRAKQF